MAEDTKGRLLQEPEFCFHYHKPDRRQYSSPNKQSRQLHDQSFHRARG
jgi:hypothetical protein